MDVQEYQHDEFNDSVEQLTQILAKARISSSLENESLISFKRSTLLLKEKEESSLSYEEQLCKQEFEEDEERI